MRCDYVHAAGSILEPYAQKANAVETCRLIKQAAEFFGIGDSIYRLCSSAKKCFGFDSARNTPLVRYSSDWRCPLLRAVIQRAGKVRSPCELVPHGVYTVRMAAKLLDMSPYAVRQLVKRGHIQGVYDRGGVLIQGEEIKRFVEHGCCVIATGRRGILRRDGGKNGN